MAGILIGDAQRQRVQFCGEAERGEELGDVADVLGKGASLRVFFFVRREKMIVFLERGAAAGGIGDDGVEVFAQEDGEVFSGEVARGIANAGMRGEGAATALSRGDDHFAAVGGEDAKGGFVEL